jgi:hypothetical protein
MLNLMTHSKRIHLARELCQRMSAQYPGQIVLAGVYGSTARGIDTPWSDLEMLFVVTDDCPTQGRRLLYQGMAVGYEVYRQSDLEHKLTHPDERWPFLMGVLSVIKVLCGDIEQVKTWVKLGESIPVETFRTALEKTLPGLVVESYGRIHSCELRGNNRDVYPAVWEVLFEMLTALCLLNRGWVTHDYFQGLLDSYKFDKLPEGYCELVPALYDAQEMGEIVHLAERLVNNFWKLIEAEGIEIKNYQQVEEMAL